jgi:hypothetical protein
MRKCTECGEEMDQDQGLCVCRRRASGSLERMVGRHIVHLKTSPRSYQNGKWQYETEERDVILMAVSGKWAMIRRPRCAPYTAEVKELVPPNEKAQARPEQTKT